MSNQPGIYPEVFNAIVEAEDPQIKAALALVMQGDEGGPVEPSELSARLNELLNTALEAPDGGTLVGLAPVIQAFVAEQVQTSNDLERQLQEKKVELKIRNFVLGLIAVPTMTIVVLQVLEDLGLI